MHMLFEFEGRKRGKQIAQFLEPIRPVVEGTGIRDPGTHGAERRPSLFVGQFLHCVAEDVHQLRVAFETFRVLDLGCLVSAWSRLWLLVQEKKPRAAVLERLGRIHPAETKNLFPLRAQPLDQWCEIAIG